MPFARPPTCTVSAASPSRRTPRFGRGQRRPRRAVRDGEGRLRRTRTGRDATGRAIAGGPATPITPETNPQTDRKRWRIAIPDRSPLPLRCGRNRDSDGAGRGEKSALERSWSTPAARRAPALAETVSVARPRQRASNENPGPRSTHRPNTEPRQDDGALHDSQRHGAAFHTAKLAALRSRLPRSRRYGCERPCRWC